MTAVEPVIRVRDLSVRAADVSLVDEVALDLLPGRVVTLVGPSGAGKSTIAAAVAGVLPESLQRTGHVEMVPGTRIAHLPQDAALTLNPARRIGAALGELATLHGDPPRGRSWRAVRARRRWRRERVEQLLSRAAFPIDDRHRNLWPRRFPFEFSGGQRTRLALAQVLAVRPDVLVLDEPSTGLDTVSRHLLVEALAAVRDEGVALLVVTHDAHVARELGDEVHGVLDGRLVPADAVVAPAAAPTPPTTSGETLLEVDRLDVRLAGSWVLRDVSIDVGPGEVVGLVGPSGSGKTTLTRAVAGLVPVESGSVRLAGRPLRRLARRDRSTLRAVQYVCQEVRASFEPDRPVLDQVARTAIRLRGESPAAAREEALRVLGRLGLDAVQVARGPGGLSGGQLRRVALARSLVARPQVLVCDEVTTGLEESLAGLILDVIDEHRREHGTAVVVVGHDLRALVRRVGRLVVLDRGQVSDDLPVGDWSQASETLRRLLTADGLTTR